MESPLLILWNDHIYKAAPRLVPRKTARGHRYEEQDGWETTGIPLMRLVKTPESLAILRMSADVLEQLP